MAPGLDGATYLETRVGLRPTSADDRAVVGRLPGWGNAWVATGHGANGLLQGPYSARVLAHAMAGVGAAGGRGAAAGARSTPAVSPEAWPAGAGVRAIIHQVHAGSETVP